MWILAALQSHGHLPSRIMIAKEKQAVIEQLQKECNVFVLNVLGDLGIQLGDTT